MKRLITILLAVTFGATATYAQEYERIERTVDSSFIERVNLDMYYRDEVVNKLSTHQVEGDLIKLEEKSIRVKPVISGENGAYENIPQAAPPEDGKEYKEYKQINLHQHGQMTVLSGLSTHQLQGEKRYVPLEDAQRVAGMQDGLTPKNNEYQFKLINPDDAEAVAMKNETTASAEDINNDNADSSYKVYRIDENGYEYQDEKPIVGGKKIKERLADGYKPITELTFYYEAKDAGLLSDNMSAKEFLSLTADEQKQLVGTAEMSASALYIENDWEITAPVNSTEQIHDDVATTNTLVW